MGKFKPKYSEGSRVSVVFDGIVTGCYLGKNEDDTFYDVYIADYRMKGERMFPSDILKPR